MKQKLITILLACVFALSACASPLTTVDKPTDVYSTPGPLATDLPAQNIDPASVATQAPVQMAANQLAAMQALATKYNISIDQIHLVKFEPMTWPDGCLGVVLPGVMCTMQQVQGYSLTFEANGRQYEYHTNQDGSSVVDAARQLATIQLVVFGSDSQLHLVNPNIPLGPTYNPAFTGFLPAGGSVNGTAYVLDFSNGPKAVAMDGNGTRDLSFITNPNYGLALWPGASGAQPRIAWGTQPTDADHPSSLLISGLDGSDLQTLLTDDAGPSRPTQLVAEFWSQDGQSLYFSREPVGIGGYIIFSGASNLFRIDIASKQVTTIIEQSASNGPMICLDAISADTRFIADHCDKTVITIRDVFTAGAPSVTIQPPADASGFKFVGSARFSPDGKRVAYALAKGDPSNEQGWVAIADTAGGASTLIDTGAPGAYFSVHGWLDDQTLLIESHGLNCTPTCINELWTIAPDGSNLQKVAEGSFQAIIDNR
jgi:hypothetical protein